MTYDTGGQGKVHFGLVSKGSGLVKRQPTRFTPYTAEEDEEDEGEEGAQTAAVHSSPGGSGTDPAAQGKVHFGQVSKGGGVVKRQPTRFAPSTANDADDDDEEDDGLETAAGKDKDARNPCPSSSQTSSSAQGKVHFGLVSKGSGVVKRQPTRFAPTTAADDDEEEEEEDDGEEERKGEGLDSSKGSKDRPSAQCKVHFGMVAKGSGLVKRVPTRYSLKAADEADQEGEAQGKEEEEALTSPRSSETSSLVEEEAEEDAEASSSSKSKVHFGLVAIGSGLVKRVPTRYSLKADAAEEAKKGREEAALISPRSSGDSSSDQEEEEVDADAKAVGSSSVEGKVHFGQDVSKGRGVVERQPTRFSPSAKDDNEDNEEVTEEDGGEADAKAKPSPVPAVGSLVNSPPSVRGGAEKDVPDVPGEHPPWVQYGSWQQRVVSDSMVVPDESCGPERVLSDSVASHSKKHVSFGRMPELGGPEATDGANAADRAKRHPLSVDTGADPPTKESEEPDERTFLDFPLPGNSKVDHQFRMAAKLMSEQILQPQIRLMIVRTVSALKSKASARGGKGPVGILEPKDRATISNQIVQPAVQIIVDRAADHMFKVNFLRLESTSDSDVPMRNFLASVMERTAIVDEIVDLTTDVLSHNVQGLEPKDIRTVEDDTLRPAVCRMVEAVAVAFRKELTFLREYTLDVSEAALDELDEEEEMVTEEVMKTMRPAIRLIVEKATASFRRILTTVEDENESDSGEVDPKPTEEEHDYTQCTLANFDFPKVKVTSPMNGMKDGAQPDPVELPIVDEEPILQDAMVEMRPAVRSMVFKAAAALKAQVDPSEISVDQCASPIKKACSFLLSPMHRDRLAVMPAGRDPSQQESCYTSSRRGSNVVELAEETFETLRPAIRNVVFKAAEAFKAKLSTSRDNSAVPPLSPSLMRELTLACCASFTLSPTQKSIPSPTRLTLPCPSPRREGRRVSSDSHSTVSEVSDVVEGNGDELDHPVVQEAFAAMRPAVRKMVEKAQAAFMAHISITRDSSQLDPLILPDGEVPHIQVEWCPGFAITEECASPRVGRTITCTADTSQPDFIEMPDSDDEGAPRLCGRSSSQRGNAFLRFQEQVVQGKVVEAELEQEEKVQSPEDPVMIVLSDDEELEKGVSFRPPPLQPLAAHQPTSAALPKGKTPPLAVVATPPLPVATPPPSAAVVPGPDLGALRHALSGMSPEQSRDFKSALLQTGGSEWAQHLLQQLRDATRPEPLFGLWQTVLHALPADPPVCRQPTENAMDGGEAAMGLHHLHYLEVELEQLAALYSSDLHLETCRAMALEQQAQAFEQATQEPELLRYQLDFLTNYSYHLGAHVASLRRHHATVLDIVKEEVTQGLRPMSGEAPPPFPHDGLLQEVLEAKLRAVECARGDLLDQTTHASLLEDRLHLTARTFADNVPLGADPALTARVADLEVALEAKQQTVQQLEAKNVDLENYRASAGELRREVEQLRALLDEEVQHSALLRRQVEQLTTQVGQRELRIQKLEQATPSVELKILRACVDEEVKRNGELRLEVETLGQELQRREAVHTHRIHELEGQLELRSTASLSSLGASDVPLAPPRPSPRAVWYSSPTSPGCSMRCSPHRCVLNSCCLCARSTPTTPAEPTKP